MKTRSKKAVSILLAAIAVSVFYGANFLTPKNIQAEMVYCPLTKKLQPVRPPKKSSENDLLKDFCIAKRKKSEFVKVFIETPKLFRLNEIQFENLAFDFLQTGKTAFKNLPDSPNFPRQNLAKSFSSAVGSGSFDKEFSFLKVKNEQFDFSRNPRPPTSQTETKSDFQIVRRLRKISQNINPRSPPANFS